MSCIKRVCIYEPLPSSIKVCNLFCEVKTTIVTNLQSHRMTPASSFWTNMRKTLLLVFGFSVLSIVYNSSVTLSNQNWKFVAADDVVCVQAEHVTVSCTCTLATELYYRVAFFVFIIQQAFFTLARDIKLKMDKKLVSSFSLTNEHLAHLVLNHG